MASLEDELQSYVLENEVNKTLRQLYLLRECIGDIEEVVKADTSLLAEYIHERIIHLYEKLGIEYGK